MSNYYRERAVRLKERKKLARSRVRRLRLDITKYERILKKKLDKCGYKYVFQKAFYDEWYFLISDFYLAKYKLVIEADGSQHYTNAKQIKKDYKHDKWLLKKGIRVKRLTNKQVEKITLRQLRNIVG